MSASDEIEKLEKQVAKLRAERPTKLTDPAAVRAIDAQIRELDGQRRALEEEAQLAAQERAARRKD